MRSALAVLELFAHHEELFLEVILKIFRCCFFTFTFFSIISCANNKPQVSLTLDSSPQGATISCLGKSMGYTTPRTFYFNKQNLEIVETLMKSCSVVWVSGVQKKYYENEKIVGTVLQENNGVRVILERPKGDGYIQDAEFAIKVQNMKTMQIQADAAQRQANAAQRQAAAEENQNNKTTTCYTNLGVTTCY